MHLLHPTSLLRVSFWSNWVLRTKTSIYKISRMLFYNTDLNFAHFANFNFANFEIEERLGLIWVKLQNGWFDLHISILGIYKVLISSMGFIFAHFVYEGCFGQIWLKITEWSIRNRFANFHFGVNFTNYGVWFCSFWIWKSLLEYFGKIHLIQGFSFI